MGTEEDLFNDPAPLPGRNSQPATWQTEPICLQNTKFTQKISISYDSANLIFVEAIHRFPVNLRWFSQFCPIFSVFESLNNCCFYHSLQLRLGVFNAKHKKTPKQ